MMSESLFVMGTDTDVGKTVVSLLCMQFLYREGYAPLYIKPFQTGCADIRDSDSDARFVYSYLPEECRHDLERSTLSCYKNPKAPHFAARDEGTHVDLDRVYRDLEVLAREGTYTHLIMEGSGGILVPITADRLLVEVAQSVPADIILVARAGLGTINHTLLSIEALDRRDLTPKGIILVNKSHAGIPHDMVEENMEAIHLFSGIRPVGVIGNIRNFAAIKQAAYDVVGKLLLTNTEE